MDNSQITNPSSDIEVQEEDERELSHILNHAHTEKVQKRLYDFVEEYKRLDRAKDTLAHLYDGKDVPNSKVSDEELRRLFTLTQEYLMRNKDTKVFRREADTLLRPLYEMLKERGQLPSLENIAQKWKHTQV